MRFGTIDGIQKPVSRVVLGVDNQTTSEEAEIFDRFIEAGGNAFDTGYIYGGGACEELLGKWVEKRGIRDQVVVEDKGAHTPHCNPEALGQQLETSLQRLRTDYVDLYLMHRDNTQIPVSEFVDALDEHRRAGRVRAFGGSNWTPARIDEANAYAAARGIAGFAAVSNQLSLSRMLKVPWEGCLSLVSDEDREWMRRSGLVLVPWSSQGRGFFTDLAGPDKTEQQWLVDTWYRDDNFERKARAATLASSRNVAEINIALAWVLAQPFPTFPVMGPRGHEELASSLKALDVELSDKEVAWLDLADSSV